MNSQFTIPTNASLFNIKTVYNELVTALGISGARNLLINPKLNQLIQDGSNQVQAGWSGTFNPTLSPLALTANEYFEQDLIHLRDNEIYTFVFDAKNTGSIKVELINSLDSSAYDISDAISAVDATIPVLLDDQNNPDRQQYVLGFVTGSYDKTNPVKIRFTALENCTLDIFNLGIVRGTFAFSEDGNNCVFTDFVRVANDTTSSYYEVSTDGGQTYSRIVTTSSDDLKALVTALSGDYYTISQINAMFLRKDVPDTALDFITFNEGFKSVKDAEFEKDVVLSNGNIITNKNGGQNGWFNLLVERGNAPTAGIRYNGNQGMWQYSNDGIDWKYFFEGSGVASSNTANSEIEYYAEILENSGFQYAYYDLFDTNGQSDDVIDFNLTYDNSKNLYKITDQTATWVILTQNVWDATTYPGTYTQFFAHVLTNQPNNGGITAYYSLTSPSSPSPPNIDSTEWIPFTPNDIITTANAINELYFKFQLDATDVEFHSFGYFFGVWNYNFASNTRLREFYNVTSDLPTNTNITIPNNGQYVNDGKTLEVYLNRVRQIINVDYQEVDEKTVKFLKQLKTGNVIEFYETFGFIDVSQDNTNLINSHINDTTSNPHNITPAIIGTYDSSTIDSMVAGAGGYNINKFLFQVPISNALGQTIGPTADILVAEINIAPLIDSTNNYYMNFARWYFGTGGLIVPKIVDAQGTHIWQAANSYGYIDTKTLIGTGNGNAATNNLKFYIQNTQSSSSISLTAPLNLTWVVELEFE